MQEFMCKVARGHLTDYLEAVGMLFLIAGVIYAAMGASCYEPVITSTITSWESGRQSTSRPDFMVTLRANDRYARPGERATRDLGGVGDPGTTQVSYRWTPPWGATNVSFGPGSEPEPGGPPYVWLNRDPSQEIHIEYDQPSLPAGESTMLATDTALAEWDGHSSATSYTTLISNERHQQAALPAPAVPPARDHPSDVADLWKVDLWIDPKDVTMTTSMCQDWFSLLQSDDAFLAMRVPVSPTTAITEGYPLPIVSGGPYSNTMQLFSYDPFGPVITTPVELRPERHTFLESSLPAAPGEHWMALGLVSETVTCPGDLSPDRWAFKMQGYLDLTHQPNNCEGCVLPLYYCYEGQEAPLVLAAARSALGGDVVAYPGWGITCLGPQAGPLTEDSEWGLGGGAPVWVTPTQSITVQHYLHVDVGSGPMTFTLDHASTLGVGWNFYDGDWGGPDPGTPLALPVVVADGEWRPFWMVSDPVPTDTAAGTHSLVVTATSTAAPFDSFWAADSIWVGGWVPPGSISLTPWLYLPLVMRTYGPG